MPSWTLPGRCCDGGHRWEKNQAPWNWNVDFKVDINIINYYIQQAMVEQKQENTINYGSICLYIGLFCCFVKVGFVAANP